MISFFWLFCFPNKGRDGLKINAFYFDRFLFDYLLGLVGFCNYDVEANYLKLPLAENSFGNIAESA